MISHRDFICALTIVTLMSLASAQEMTVSASGFGPVSGPRIVWTPMALSSRVNFTLTSAASSDSASRYVSFAFADAPSMDSAKTVYDCYEVGGEVKLGTSRNANLDKIGRTNVNDASALSQLTILAAGKLGGVLTCQFSMDFNPTLEGNVLLASGLMDAASTVSSPTKKKHSARYASTNKVATPSDMAPSFPAVPTLSAVPAAETGGTTPTAASSRTTSSTGARKVPCDWLVLFVLPLLFGASM